MPGRLRFTSSSAAGLCGDDGSHQLGELRLSWKSRRVTELHAVLGVNPGGSVHGFSESGLRGALGEIPLR
jgi:hypothetical protein